MEWTRGVVSKREQNIKCMDFSKGKWKILLFRKAITKINFFFYRLKSPFSYFQCPLALKPQNITEPLLKNMQGRTLQCCQLLIIIIIILFLLLLFLFLKNGQFLLSQTVSVSLKFYLRMAWCSCSIRTCNMFPVSNLNIYMFECLTRKLFIRLFIAASMINEGS